MDYQKQANDVAKKLGITLICGEPEYKKHFIGDTEERYVFRCSLKRGKRKYTFDFGQSIAAGSNEPTMYDVLACLQKYDVGSFENFCGDFGYDEDSRKAERIYKAVCEEYEGLCRLFNEEEFRLLQEIN